MSNDLRFRVFGEDVSASKMVEGIGSKISGLGDKIGGEVGALLSSVGQGFDELGDGGASAGKKLGVAGGVVAGVGVALQSMASDQKEATAQLKASVEANGGSWEEYKVQVDEAIDSGQKYAFGASDVVSAMQKITDSTGDPTKAIEYMGLVEDLAAAKHIGLVDAAALVAKSINGNEKLFKSYNITVGDTNSKLDQLSQKLSGQAEASVDSFNGRLKVLRTEVTDWVGEVGGQVGTTVTTVGTIAAAIGGAMEMQVLGKVADSVPVIGRFRDGWQNSAVAASAFSGRAGQLGGVVRNNLTPATVAWVGAAGLGVTALYAWGKNAIDASNATADLTEAIEADGGAIGDRSRAVAAANLAESGLLDKAKSLGVNLGDLTNAYLGNEDALGRVRAQLGPLAKEHENEQSAAAAGAALAGTVMVPAYEKQAAAASDLLFEVEKQSGASRDQAAAVALSGDAANLAADAAKNLTDVTDLQIDTTYNAEAAMNDYLQTLREAADEWLSARGASISWEQAVDDASRALKDNGRNVDIGTQKGRDNRRALLDMVRAGQDYRQGLVDQGKPLDKVNEKVADMRDQLYRTGRRMGLSKEAARDYADQLKGIPKSVTTDIAVRYRYKFTFNGQQYDLSTSEAIAAALGVALPDVGVTKTPEVAGARADGGPVRKGSTYLVGEKGPELYVADQDGTIIPNGATLTRPAASPSAPATSGAPQTHYHLHPTGVFVGDRYEFARWAQGQLDDARAAGQIR